MNGCLHFSFCVVILWFQAPEFFQFYCRVGERRGRGRGRGAVVKNELGKTADPTVGGKRKRNPQRRRANKESDADEPNQAGPGTPIGRQDPLPARLPPSAVHVPGRTRRGAPQPRTRCPPPGRCREPAAPPLVTWGPLRPAALQLPDRALAVPGTRRSRSCPGPGKPRQGGAAAAAAAASRLSPGPVPATCPPPS